ncbi:MAG: T9SS type A sorting domain-containing protein [Ignavibacteriae bacterium]|nr:T9SS type A sorting domain-containing protein [Ignavibacteriota bacterium]
MIKNSNQKLILLISILFICFSPLTFAQYDSLSHDGLWRTYLTHLPPQYVKTEDINYPLVLVLHGGFGNAYNIEEQSNFSAKADTAKNPFIVVYPEGIKSPIGITTWNAGGCCGYATNNNIDDVGFISSLLDTIINKYSIDTNNIFASGMSNGGMMSYRLAAELSNRIAAIGPVASVMVNELYFEPIQSIPIIHFHSYMDENVPILGGYGSGVSDYRYPPLDSVLNVWADVNSCQVIDTIFNEEGEYLYKTWRDCSNDANIDLYVTYDGGHSWPGGTVPRIGGDPISQKLNATDLIWDFFQKHPKNKITDIAETKISPNEFHLDQNYPNPFNPITNINYQIPTQNINSVFVQLSVYNILSQEIVTLVNEFQKSGNYNIKFDGSNLPSGIYFYKLQLGNFSELKKMVLLK